MKTSTIHHEDSIVHHENLDYWSRKSWRPFMKLSTVRYENLGYSLRKSQPAIMKISTYYHDDLDCSS